MKDLKLWLAISNLRNVPHILLFYSRIQDLTDNLFEISDDEDEFEVLRRVRTIFVFVLKMSIFIGSFRDLLYREDCGFRKSVWN
jgi:hypothetical protein